MTYSGLTLPFAIVAICYKNDRVATDLFHWRKVHFRQIKSPFLPIMVQNLLTGDLYTAVWGFPILVRLGHLIITNYPSRKQMSKNQ